MSAADELRQLADRLDQHLPPYVILDPGTTRAAAVALRHHANLLAAIGDPAWLTVAMEEGRVDWPAIRRMVDAFNPAAAAVSPSPPTTCPTCGSDDPAIGRVPASDDSYYCPDLWHQQT